MYIHLRGIVRNKKRFISCISYIVYSICISTLCNIMHAQRIYDFCRANKSRRGATLNFALHFRLRKWIMPRQIRMTNSLWSKASVLAGTLFAKCAKSENGRIYIYIYVLARRYDTRACHRKAESPTARVIPMEKRRAWQSPICNLTDGLVREFCRTRRCYTFVRALRSWRDDRINIL